MYYSFTNEIKAENVSMEDLEKHYKDIYSIVLKKLSDVKQAERKLNFKLKEFNEKYGEYFENLLEPKKEVLENIIIIQELKDILESTILDYHNYINSVKETRDINSFDVDLINYYLYN